ncbi:MAG: hypothetical protein LPK80_07385 [Bacteroidota bacterium]|nr:hypothetical protein [Bacteroidota bacterium]MDX5447737.1 hypothetical protein [Bacteroidota bacterium]
MKRLLLLVLVLQLQSCTKAPSDYKDLKRENKELKEQLEACQLDPGKMLKEAMAFYDSKDYEIAETSFEKLILENPDSEEAKKAKEVLEKMEVEKEKKRLEKEKRLATATQKMRTNLDEFSGTTWYRDKTSPNYTDVNGFFLYFGKKKEGEPWLRMCIQYTADDWLFINSYKIKVDDKTYTITENRYGEIETDNGGGVIWEWLDRNVSQSDMEMLYSMANGKDVVIRHVGRQYHKDRKITSKEKKAILNVIDAYHAFGGTLK